MNKRITASDLKNKKGNSKIVAMTCYSARLAVILDRHADLLLVGDSMGMVLYGHSNTLSVTKRMMTDHGKAVVNNTKKSLVVLDLPFGTYESGKEKAYETASNLLEETGASAVKLEGGKKVF